MNFVDCWHIETSVFDLEDVSKNDPDLRLIKKSVLKKGYRAHFTNDQKEIEKAEFYKSYLLGINQLFYIKGSGVYILANIDLTDNELYFEKYNLPTGYDPSIFYSWQSDYNPSRSHIKDAIANTIDDINDNHSPTSEIQIIESTRLEDGSDDIVEAIKRNIDRSLLCVFDITNVATVSEKDSNDLVKVYPNANVVFEMSYALQRKRGSQIILVKKKRDDFSIDEVPFDFSRNRHLPYKKPSNLSNALDEIVKKNLRSLRIIQ